MYSQIVLEHFRNPHNAGVMEQPDRVGEVALSEFGVQMTFQLRVEGDRVVQANFQTFGCGAAIAAGSRLTELVEGKSLHECLSLTPEQLAEALGGLPGHKFFCAEVAIRALRAALAGEQTDE